MRLLFVTPLLFFASPTTAQNCNDFPQNIVFILADDIGLDMVSVYDDEFGSMHPNSCFPNKTPNLQGLAEEGLVFRNAWSAPACSPARAAILTGQFGHRTGIGTVLGTLFGTPKPGLQHDIVTIPTILRNLSTPYNTAALGKWHLADVDQHPPQTGDPFHPLGTTGTPWFNTYAGGMEGLGSYNNWCKTYGGTPIIQSACSPPAACAFGGPDFCSVTTTEYRTVDTANDAIWLIDQFANAAGGGTGEPFFIYAAFNAPHTPLQAPANGLPDPPGGCTVTKPTNTSSCIGNNTLCPSAVAGPHDTRCLVEWLDYEIGLILCALENPALDLPTTVIFMGDNGTTGNTPDPGDSGGAPDPAVAGSVLPFNPNHAKATVFQGGVNVPLIVRSTLHVDDDPNEIEFTDALVTATDMFATAEHLATGTAPTYSLPIDSISFVPVLCDPEGPSPRKFAYAEFFDDNFVPVAGGGPPGDYDDELLFHHRAIRDEAGYKLIQMYDRNGMACSDCLEERFYNLAVDPFETNNLIDAATDPLNSQFATLNPIYNALLDAMDPPAGPTRFLSLWPTSVSACLTTNYCTAGYSFNNCQSYITAVGTASATAPSGFCLIASGSEGNKSGLFYWGTGGQQALPWGNGTSLRCVAGPKTRGDGDLPLSGTMNRCDGFYFEDLNAHWTAFPSKNPGQGAVADAQFWYRDPFNTSNQTTSLSDGIRFIVGP